MTLKISEGNPLNPLSSCVYAIGEEVASQTMAALTCSVDCTSMISSANRNRSLDCEEELVFGVVSALFLATNALYAWAVLSLKVITDFFTDCFECICGNGAKDIVSEEALNATRTLKINRSRIAETPKLIDMGEVILSDEVDAINIREFLTIFDEVFKDEKGETPRSLVVEYINYVQYRQGPSEMYKDNLTKILKLLIFELRKEEIPLIKKKTVFLEIAEAKRNCQPRVYAESLRQYQEITGQGVPLDEQILTRLQLLKQNIVLEHFQGGQFHVLNYACMTVKDWGLSSDPVILADPYAHSIGALGLSGLSFRYVLNKDYTPARIVSSLQEYFSLEKDNRLLNKYFQEKSEFLPEGWERNFFKADGKTINCEGTAWLLKDLGFLY